MGPVVERPDHLDGTGLAGCEHRSQESAPTIMWDTVKEFETIGNRTLMGILLACIIGAYVYAIWKANKTEGNGFQFVDVLMENGKASKWSIILFGSWTIHTWVVVSWVMNSSATLADLTLYGTTWVAPLVAKMFIAPPKDGGTT